MLKKLQRLETHKGNITVSLRGNERFLLAVCQLRSYSRPGGVESARINLSKGFFKVFAAGIIKQVRLTKCQAHLTIPIEQDVPGRSAPGSAWFGLTDIQNKKLMASSTGYTCQ